MKLHLGCGERYIPGFYHVDARNLPHVDEVMSAKQLTSIGDETVTLLYASHVLEHFKRDETEAVLIEWKRVLTAGGILRLSVPDFDALLRIYDTYKDLNLILGPLYGRSDYPENTHHIVFTFDSLSEILRRVGFEVMRRWNWRETEHSHIDDYSQAYIPHMNKETGIQVSLNIEAVKN